MGIVFCRYHDAFRSGAVVILSFLGALAGCSGDGAGEALGVSVQAVRGKQGKHIFEGETFGGNGRTCVTCHSEKTGTLSPEDVQARYAANPNDPLFRPIDSDDGLGNGYTRLLNEATIRIKVALPPNIWPVDDPTATSVTVFRGIPTINNTPALDPVLMFDAREPDLETQAAHAILAHFEPTVAPTPAQLAALAEYERKQFSSGLLRAYALGNAPLPLPDGHTESEIRGRQHFNELGLCGQCHSGPLLNKLAPSFFFASFGNRFSGALAGFPASAFGTSEPQRMPNPMRRFSMVCPSDGSSFACENVELFAALLPMHEVTVENGVLTASMPDPGYALTIANLDFMADGKTPILRGIKDTAPYFHDNSAHTLEEVVHHYKLFFETLPYLATPFLGGRSSMTPQEEADIVAYLRLL